MNQSFAFLDRPSIKIALGALCLAVALAVWTNPVFAYSCAALYSKADQSIKEAESLIGPKTDARILAKIEEAKGLVAASKMSHNRASQRHTGNDGKYMHGDSVRLARWAESLAHEAIFLMSGKPR